MATETAKVIAKCFILTLTLQLCCGSAIPIWEFLTRHEKMSYLYSAFAQLVSIQCKTTTGTSTIPVNQCKRNLLGYGNSKLQSFSEAELDAIDPYQHGANQLIWAAIMRDHPSSLLITTRKPLPTPPASSIIILTHQKPLQQPSTPVSLIAGDGGGVVSSSNVIGNNKYPKNPLFDSDDAAEKKHKYAMDMDIAYFGYPTPNPEAAVFAPELKHQQHQHQQQQQQKHNKAQQQQQQQHQQSNNLHETYLTGPMVFRLRPDGTPVEEDKYKPLPRDEDLEIYTKFSAPTNSNAGRHNKHKIATISALKQQHFATLALQQQLQPPLEQPRNRRNFSTTNRYYYGPGRI